MRLPALAAQLQGFAHSADNVDVGVSLRKACVGKYLGAVSFRPTHPDLFVGRNPLLLRTPPIM